MAETGNYPSPLGGEGGTRDSGKVRGKPASRPHKPGLDEMTVGRTEVPLGGPKPEQPYSSGGKPGTRTYKRKSSKVRRK